MTEKRARCGWATSDPLYVRYHDEEWGVPVHDDRRLFELLLLEGAQAGLSWLTILRKREGYAKAFSGFDPRKIARYDAAKKMVMLDDIMRFPADCVNPPADMKAEAWIKAGFPGAKGCP